MRHPTLKSAVAQLKRAVSKVEVERKFNPSARFTSLFSIEERAGPRAQRCVTYDNQNGRSFTALRQPGELIRDTYYDTQQGKLGELGLWVRQRRVSILPLDPVDFKDTENRETDPQSPGTDNKESSHWNAKLRIGGHFENSHFVELDGKMDVSNEVLRITDMKTKLEDLQAVSDLLTRRSSWEVTQLAGGKTPSATMTIVVDDVTEAEPKAGISDGATFRHVIGEVELFQELVSEGKDDAELEAYRKQIAAQKMDELKTFMQFNSDLFLTNPKPIGKLTAYDTWRTLGHTS